MRVKRKAFVAIDDLMFSDNCGPSPATGRPTPPPPTGQPLPPPLNTLLVPGTSPPDKKKVIFSQHIPKKKVIVSQHIPKVQANQKCCQL